MKQRLLAWLSSGALAKCAGAVIGLVVIYALGYVSRRSVQRYVDDSATRYRVRKLISFAVYTGFVFLLVTTFSDRFASLTVAFGMAGAGIAFSLQEVIASIAGGHRVRRVVSWSGAVADIFQVRASCSREPRT